MWVIWTLLSLAIAGGLVWGVIVLIQHYPLIDQAQALFQTVSGRLPEWVTFDHALVIGLVTFAVIAVLLGLAAVAMMMVVGGGHMRLRAQRTALERAGENLRLQVQQEYERLIGLSDTLTQKLNKDAIQQNILEAAKQFTSLPRFDSIVALWMLDFETDRMRFARAIRCDESFFQKKEFDLTEAPLAKLMASRQVMTGETWQSVFPFVRAEKAAHLGEAKSLMLVPLIIERTLLGLLVVFCHPDMLKRYEQQSAFFNAAWGQCSLALGIAIQEELAILDRLTGVANRAYFMKRLGQEIDRANRYQLPLGLLMVDIDHFKMVNDTLGHPQGDVVLKIVSRILKREMRAIDLVGRYGGEEFIVMLPETGYVEQAGQEASGALIAAERIRKAVEQEFCMLQKPLNLTVSIGVCVRRYPEDRQLDIRELIRVTDEQLYRAKTTGRNQCCSANDQPSSPEQSKPTV